MPGKQVMDYFGWTMKVVERLAKLNDSEGKSLVQIADWIEKNL